MTLTSELRLNCGEAGDWLRVIWARTGTSLDKGAGRGEGAARTEGELTGHGTGLSGWVAGVGGLWVTSSSLV